MEDVVFFSIFAINMRRTAGTGEAGNSVDYQNHGTMSKISFRFYKDHEVRAIWDEEKSTWWFSIVDIVGAITDSPNPRKYWSVQKTRLKKAGNELTTRCSQLKMTAADGKRYATDCFAQDDIIQLVRVIPSKKTEEFLDWFVYSDNTIDGQSRKKAYKDYLDAMIASHMDSTRIRELLRGAMTDRIDDREIFMKGIDYSYYYEQED